MSKKLKVFTLTLSKWLRGGELNSSLYDSGTRTYCCLGQFGSQCGISNRALSAKPLPADVAPSKVVGDFDLLLTSRGVNSVLAKRAAAINDNSRTTDDEKIAALRPVFRRWGYKIVVVP